MTKIIRKRNKLGQFTKTSPWTKKFSRFATIMLLIGLNIGILNIPITDAFYNDIENSTDNIFTASSLIFSLASPADFSPVVTPTATSSREISLVNGGSLDFDYSVSATNTVGVLCDHLNLTAKLEGSDVYTGSIAGFNYNAGQFSAATTDWQFIASSTSNDPALQNQTCHFDFVFDGVQIGGVGFSDREIISNTVTAGVWNKVVINKVYADPDAAHMSNPSYYFANEWIELYNLSDSPVDISGWKIADNTVTDTIPVSSPIPAHGFAIITATSSTWNYWSVPDDVVKIVLGSSIGNGLGNDGDRVILKMPDGAEVDAMSYGTNISVFDPSVPDVAEGHILARVPNGVDTDTAADWKDLSLPTVSMVNPVGGETWYVGDSYDVKWLAHNGNGADNALKISLWYSNDSGATWAEFASNIDNTGIYHWQVPLFIGSYYVPSHISKIRAIAVGPENFMVQAIGSSLDFCPPIDYDALTPTDQQLVDQLVASGVIDPSEVIKGGIVIESTSIIEKSLVDLSIKSDLLSTTTADSATSSEPTPEIITEVASTTPEITPDPIMTPPAPEEPIIVPETTVEPVIETPPATEPTPVVETPAVELPTTE